MPVYKVDGKKKYGLQRYRVIINWVDDSGKKRSKETHAYGKAAAEEEEARLLQEVRSGMIDKPEEPEEEPAPTLEELVEMYKADRGPELRRTTLDKKIGILRVNAYEKLGKLPIDRITQKEMLAWREWIAGKSLSTVTKNNAYRELRCILNYAVERKIIKENPIKAIRPFRDPLEQAQAVKLRYYTKEQWKLYEAQLRKWAEETGTLRSWGIYVFFQIAYLAGLRKGEINALRWTDIEGEYLWVRRSVTQKVKGEKWLETPPKTKASVRKIQMPKNLIDVLAEHKQRSEKVPGWKESMFICGGPNPIPDTVIENANKDCAKAAGLPHITVHEFRHSHASLLCNAGIQIKEISRRLGHNDVQITLKVYAHLYPTEEERAVAILNEI